MKTLALLAWLLLQVGQIPSWPPVQPAPSSTPTPAHVQGIGNFTTSSSGSSITLTLPATVASGDLVVGFASGPAATSSIVDDKSNTYTVVDFNATSGVSTFYHANTSNGPKVITITFGSSSSFLSAAADEYSGVATTSPLDAHVIASSTGTSVTSGNITPTTNGDLIYGIGVNYSSLGPVTVAAGSGYTLRQSNTASGDPVFGTEDRVQATAAAIAATFTSGSSQTYAVGALAFKP